MTGPILVASVVLSLTMSGGFLAVAMRRARTNALTLDARELLRPQSSSDQYQLHLRLLQAGFFGDDALDLYVMLRGIAWVVGVGVSGLTLFLGGLSTANIIVAGCSLAMATWLPSAWLNRRIRQRQEAVRRSLPNFLDMLVVCMDAGLGLEKALERIVIAPRSGSLLYEEMRCVLADLRIGLSLERAFRRFAERNGSSEVQALSIIVVKAAELGVGIADLLRSHARSLRQNAMLNLEEASGKANAQLALPLTLCLVPAALIFLAGPALLSLIKMF